MSETEGKQRLLRALGVEVSDELLWDMPEREFARLLREARRDREALSPTPPEEG